MVYGTDCIETRYNFCKLVGQAQLDFLTHYCSVFVDFKRVTVTTQCLGALCKLHPKCPWLKLCLLCDLYNTANPATKSGTKGVADKWNKATIVDITKCVSNEVMVGMESYVASFL